MKRKILFIIIIVVVAFTIFGINAHREQKNKEDEMLSSSNTQFEEEELKIWQDDAKKYEITVFMNGYREYPIKDLYAKVKEYSNEIEYSNNLFFEKYIKEYEKIDVGSLSEKELEFLSLYTILLFDKRFDYDNSSIKNIWSYNYENDGSVKENVRENLSVSRGFLFKMDIKDEEYILHLHEEYSYNGYSKINYTKGEAFLYKDISIFKKYYGNLNENGGTLSGTYASWYDKSGIKYSPENKEDYISLLQKYHSFFDFMNEYADIYWKHYSETTSEVNFNKITKPKVGMTKSEVLNTDWGYPTRKNIDTYSWGTKEQWVYNKYGYVYFENDIVTSVSER